MNNKTQIIKVSLLSALALAVGVTGAYFTRGSSIANAPIDGVTSDGQTVISVAPDDASQIKKGDVFGSSDETSFKDNTQGFLQGSEDLSEGTHVLLRAGGNTQTVTLMSSVTDLNMFIGMNIKVWGETFKGQSSGWLMDVGRVEVLDTQGKKPE